MASGTVQGRNAFKHVHAELASLYSMQRKHILSPSAANLAKLRGGEVLAQHTAAHAALQPYSSLREHPLYSGAHAAQRRSYRQGNSRFHSYFTRPSEHSNISRICCSDEIWL